MIELNGELIMPKDLPNAENDENQTSTSVLGDDRVELGAIRFTEEVSVCFHIDGLLQLLPLSLPSDFLEDTYVPHLSHFSCLEK